MMLAGVRCPVFIAGLGLSVVCLWCLPAVPLVGLSIAPTWLLCARGREHVV